jgi:hypothetical protein
MYTSSLEVLQLPKEIEMKFSHFRLLLSIPLFTKQLAEAQDSPPLERLRFTKRPPKFQRTIRLLTLIALTVLMMSCAESAEQRRKRESAEFANGAIFWILVIGAGWWWWWDTERQNKRTRNANEQAQVKHRQARVEHTKKWLAYFADNILVECLVIDSNIWMNEQYEVFFKALKIAAQEMKFKIALPGAQFDEICNIKKRTGYGELNNQRARLAITRIEQALKEDWLRINSISIDSDKAAYADPLLVKIIRSALNLGQRVCFLSDDVELRVRIRAQMADLTPETWAIVEMQTILSGCEAISHLELSQT